MDQNQTVDNDLQKAIDDITNNTNIDPVFSDPVAAPSSIPEDDTGELSEPVGPFAAPVDTIAAPAPDLSAFVPEPPVAPVDALGAPAFSAPTPPVEAAPYAAPAPEFQPAPAPAPVAQAIAPEPSEPVMQAPAPAEVAPAPGLNIHQIKTAALRDLIPIMDSLNLPPSQRFNICRSIFEDLHNYDVLEQAYRAASEIPDNSERAEALLYLVESIDKM